MSAMHRRRPAATARVAATGLSVAGAVVMIGAMHAASRPSGAAESSAPADPAPAGPEATAASSQSIAPDSVVIMEVHRTVYVDEQGNPVDPSAMAASGASAEFVATTAPAGSRSSTTVKRTTRTTTAAPTGTTVPATGSGASSTTPPPTTVRRTTTTAPTCSGSKCP